MDDSAPSPEAVDGPFDGLWVVDSHPGHGTTADRRWAVLAHLSIFVLALAFPLVVALSKGERSAYVGHQAVEALNFQTTVLLALLLCTLTAAATVGLVLLPVVVVGARGHRWLHDRVLGSTSQKLVHHCTCPVLVVHKPK